MRVVPIAPIFWGLVAAGILFLISPTAGFLFLLAGLFVLAALAAS
jgi:hypothetical protein